MANGLSNLSIDSTGSAYSKYSNKVVDTTKGDEATSYMDFDSYLKVLAAQMSNQDFNDPMSDSEMLQQMSSYSMLEGIKNMTAQSNISYATNLVGKAVTVNDGYDYDTGIVESVVVTDNKPYLVVNGSKYEVSTVSNVTSSEIYDLLSRLIDQEVNIHGATDDEIIASGKVTNVLVLDGTAYVIVDGKDKYPLKDVSLKKAEGSGEGGSDDTSDKTENGEEGTNGSEGASDSTDTTDTTIDNAVTDSGYMARSEALFSELMTTIDSIGGVNAKADAELNSNETVTVTELDIPNYAAAYIAEYQDLQDLISETPIYADTVANNNTANNTVNAASTDFTASTQNAGYGALYNNSTVYPETSSVSNNDGTTTTTTALQSGRYDIPLTTSNFSSVVNGSRTGRLASTLTNEQVFSLITSGEYSTRYSAKYGLEVYSDSNPGISTADCKPHRLDADKYPIQSAIADAYGTRMYDIKFINNRAITSRIDTSRVIGKTISGREISEIGFCGKGRLGEVVTFKDGKQRVEIMLDNGNSGWLETSGRYTIDQIINQEVGDDVTPFEVAIAYYASSQSAQSFEAFKQNLIAAGLNLVG